MCRQKHKKKLLLQEKKEKKKRKISLKKNSIENGDGDKMSIFLKTQKFNSKLCDVAFTHSTFTIGVVQEIKIFIITFLPSIFVFRSHKKKYTLG